MEKLLKYLQQYGKVYKNDEKFPNQGKRKSRIRWIIDLHPGNKAIDNQEFMEFAKKKGMIIQLNNSI